MHLKMKVKVKVKVRMNLKVNSGKWEVGCNRLSMVNLRMLAFKKLLLLAFFREKNRTSCPVLYLRRNGNLQRMSHQYKWRLRTRHNNSVTALVLHFKIHASKSSLCTGCASNKGEWQGTVFFLEKGKKIYIQFERKHNANIT
jgi:hypothetical protein